MKIPAAVKASIAEIDTQLVSALAQRRDAVIARNRPKEQVAAKLIDSLLERRLRLQIENSHDE